MTLQVETHDESVEDYAIFVMEEVQGYLGCAEDELLQMRGVIDELDASIELAREMAEKLNDRFNEQ